MNGATLVHAVQGLRFKLLPPVPHSIGSADFPPCTLLAIVIETKVPLFVCFYLTMVLVSYIQAGTER